MSAPTPKTPSPVALMEAEGWAVDRGHSQERIMDCSQALSGIGRCKRGNGTLLALMRAYIDGYEARHVQPGEPPIIAVLCPTHGLVKPGGCEHV